MFASVSTVICAHFVFYKNRLPFFSIAAWRLPEDETGIIRSALLGSVTNLSVNVSIKNSIPETFSLFFSLLKTCSYHVSPLAFFRKKIYTLNRNVIKTLHLKPGKDAKSSH